MSNNQFVLYCDSADLYVWMLRNKHKNIKHKKRIGTTRAVTLTLPSQRQVEVSFVIKQESKDAYDRGVGALLSKTAGTPDYILMKGSEPIVCIEDSATAPVGNSVIQRLDKLFPLMMDSPFPVEYIGPLRGLDKSQEKERSWEQSWFYKSFAVNRPDLFRLTSDGKKICNHVFSSIVDKICSSLDGTLVRGANISRSEIEQLHEAAVKKIRTYDGKTFKGKLFKPNNTDAHPIQSTLMLICELRKKLELPPVTIKFGSAIERKNFLKSRSKRLVRSKTLMGI